MALPKSGKSDSNVTNLADARKKRDRDGAKSKAESIEHSVDTPPAKPVSKASAPARVSKRRFDREKVDRIKAEIARGDYDINYLRVADKYIEHERFS